MRICPRCNLTYNDVWEACCECGTRLVKEGGQGGTVVRKFIRIVAGLFIYLLVVPSAVVALFSYLKYCMHGSLYYKNFLSSLPEFSYKPVIAFYERMFYLAQDFIQGLFS